MTFQSPRPRPVALIIFDGFGVREPAADNAVTAANMPFWRELNASCPATTLSASEQAVGLPEGQMGNSEVGHLNIGAGRVVWQELTLIDRAIAQAVKGEPSELTSSPAFQQAIAAAKKPGATLHIMGLLSPGGVHSSEVHIFSLVKLAAAAGVPRIRIHAFLDGRDTPPQSAAASLQLAQSICAAAPQGVARIASVCGRYYAMDRDKRWDRTARAYALLTEGGAGADLVAPDAMAALTAAYSRGETDEFVQPTAIAAPQGDKTNLISNGDSVIFMNFRADRARQLTHAFCDKTFDGFERRVQPKLGSFVTLTRYEESLSAIPVIFPPKAIKNGLGEYLSRLGLAQLRIAETEKYAHVTYFFSGGVETVYPGEDRVLVPSPKVATYDLAPAMSAVEVADRLVGAINSDKYDFILVNFANGDMVGHTGKMEAAVSALETLDQCLSRVIAAIRLRGGAALVTADHGNAEKMFDEKTKQPHTAHTTNPVPLVYVGERPATLTSGGALGDLAPTVLSIMGLQQPPEMTGKTLIHFADVSEKA